MTARDSLPLDRLEAIARQSKAFAIYDIDGEPEWHRLMRAIEDIIDELEIMRSEIQSFQDESDFAAIQVSIQHIFYHIYDSRYLREVVDLVIDQSK
ncbi:MAG: hypothetical protein LCH38_02880 [Proteobacteria bacterium]|nr:hypothetical protein [Pseudomonadota bacterium]